MGVSQLSDSYSFHCGDDPGRNILLGNLNLPEEGGRRPRKAAKRELAERSCIYLESTRNWRQMRGTHGHQGSLSHRRKLEQYPKVFWVTAQCVSLRGQSAPPLLLSLS